MKKRKLKFRFIIEKTGLNILGMDRKLWIGITKCWTTMIFTRTMGVI